MKVLIIGSGGREHSLAWKCAQSQSVEKVFVAPGNAGTALEDKIKNVVIDVMDFSALADFAEQESIGLSIVGPEAPLVDGIVDYFQKRHFPCFGPSKQAAQLEGSKAFTKDFCRKHGVPTAAYQTFTEIDPAVAFIQSNGTPIVIKADGLVDGKNILPMATSQDHKARDNGDKGPNTGGMGAYSPASVVTDEVYQRIMDKVILPTVAGMAEDGNDYTGFLYAGLMVSPDGEVNVVEFNCRFGDPEAQPVMMRLQSDLPELCLAALEQALDSKSAEWDSRCAVGVVLASGGYPDLYAKGDVISGIPKSTKHQKVFHAGTSEQEGNIVTSGGRVLCATALGISVSEARAAAYELVNSINWKNVYFRTDIAYRAIARENT